MEERFGDAGVSNHFVTEMTCHAFCPVAPKHDALLHVHNTRADRKALKDAPVDFCIVEREHACARKIAIEHIGKIHRDFKV